MPRKLLTADLDMALHVLPAHTAKRLAARKPSGKKLPHLNGVMLAGGLCETAQLDQITLVVASKSGIRIGIRLDPQPTLGEQVATVGAAASREAKEPGPWGALGCKGTLQLPLGIDPATAIRRKPLQHERHPAEVLIGDKRAVAFGLEPVAKVDELATRGRPCNPGPSTGA